MGPRSYVLFHGTLMFSARFSVPRSLLSGQAECCGLSDAWASRAASVHTTLPSLTAPFSVFALGSSWSGPLAVLTEFLLVSQPCLWKLYPTPVLTVGSNTRSVLSDLLRCGF